MFLDFRDEIKSFVDGKFEDGCQQLFLAHD